MISDKIYQFSFVCQITSQTRNKSSMKSPSYNPTHKCSLFVGCTDWISSDKQVFFPTNNKNLEFS